MNKLFSFSLFLPLLIFIHFSYFKIKNAIYHNQKFLRGSEVYFVFSEEFSDEEINEILPAIEDWKAFLSFEEDILRFHNDNIFLGELDKDDKKYICFGLENNVLMINVIKPESDSFFWNIYNILGLTNSIGYHYGNCYMLSIMLNYNDEFDYDKRIVFAHEIGHAVGLSHVKHDISMMSEYYNPNVVFFTQYDAKEFCKIYDCSIEEYESLAFFHAPVKK
jgi:hypothetical protein